MKGMQEYAQLKKEAIRGWNTWNSKSMMSHVYMPYGFAIDLAVKDYGLSAYKNDAYVRQEGTDDEHVFPGGHMYDGSYTMLNFKWKGIEMDVETATIDDDIVIYVHRLAKNKSMPVLVAECAMLWNRNGHIDKLDNNIIAAEMPDGKQITVYCTEKEEKFDPYLVTKAHYISVNFAEEVGFSTGKDRSLDEIKEIIAQGRKKYQDNKAQYGDLEDAYDAMQTCLAWDTIYDPLKDRIISTVSRNWNYGWSGYVMFCWDNYFAACMALLDSKAIAYSNCIEMTHEKTESGFVPNWASSLGTASRDRSQPPVGSMTLREIYRKYRETWIIEYLFDELYVWNTWWHEHRQISEGVFAWGSDPYEPVHWHVYELGDQNTRKGGALESGLDNSPMYDEPSFDTEKHMLNQSDVGLTGLLIMDTYALIELAEIIGRNEEAAILKDRVEKAEKGLQSLWNEEDGIFHNFRTDINEPNKRLSPTHFYALNGKSVTKEQYERMINEHFYNPNEFWGDYIMPSIARNDPAYPEQDYWRGRIWGPMNFLAYIAMKQHGTSQATKDLADKSVKLILKEWLELGHVHENYCADTGAGCNVYNSDSFYHWGGLLTLVALMEYGYLDDPSKPLE